MVELVLLYYILKHICIDFVYDNFNLVLVAASGIISYIIVMCVRSRSA